MSNISDQLMPSEIIMIEERQHWFALIPWGIFIIPIFRWKKTTVAVTDKRIICVSGIFMRDTFEARLNKVASVTFQEPLFGKIFNYGNLAVRNTGGEQFKYQTIRNAKAIRKTFNEAVDKMEKTA